MWGIPVGLGAKRTRIINYIILENRMATLTETAIGVRKLIKLSLLGLAAFLVLKLGLFMYDTYLKVARPSPAPPATVAFGKLPKMAFPEKLQPAERQIWATGQRSCSCPNPDPVLPLWMKARSLPTD